MIPELDTERIWLRSVWPEDARADTKTFSAVGDCEVSRRGGASALSALFLRTKSHGMSHGGEGGFCPSTPRDSQW